MPNRVKVAGTDELVHACVLINDGLEHDMAVAHLEVAGVIVPAIVSLVPIRTGELASGFRAESSRTRAWITNAVPYAGVQNWGWPAHNIEARYFATDGARSTESEWIGIYNDAIQERINQGVTRSGADNPRRDR